MAEIIMRHRLETGTAAREARKDGGYHYVVFAE
jgi:hypothetical protein